MEIFVDYVSYEFQELWDMAVFIFHCLNNLE